MSNQKDNLSEKPTTDLSGESAQTTTPNQDASAIDHPTKALESEIASLQEQLLRSRAEIENNRRRAEEEVAKTRKFAVEAFAESLLPVKDSLEAAIMNHPGDAQPASSEQILEGVHATLRQLQSALERNKVLEVCPAPGEKFDPHKHQAISAVAAAQDPNTIVTVLQKGYLIADRVLRPALVTVAATT